MPAPLTNRPWSNEDDAQLYRDCLRRTRPGRNHFPSIGERDWGEVADSFPGRSVKSCKRRYGILKAHAGGTIRYRSRAKLNPMYVRHEPQEIILRQNPVHLPLPASLTAFICGDPLPGRSALDRKLAGMPA